MLLYFVLCTQIICLKSPENIFITRTSDTPLFFVSPTLEKKTAGNCDLFMLADKPGIQLALKERRSGNILGFEVIPTTDKKQSDWKELLENTSAHSKLLRNFEFLKVTIGIMSSEFTLVPEALYKPGDENIYFKKNYSTLLNTNVKAQHISPLHLYTIFGIENDLEKELNHLFQDPQLWHYSQALLSGIGMIMKADAGKLLWLNIRSNKIDIVVSENKKLLLLNSFSFQTNEDILYYTLFVCEQLELNPEKISMTVTGDIEDHSILYQLLNQYIRNISIPEEPTLGSFSFTENDLPFHHYAMLYNLATCE